MPARRVRRARISAVNSSVLSCPSGPSRCRPAYQKCRTRRKATQAVPPRCRNQRLWRRCEQRRRTTSCELFSLARVVTSGASAKNGSPLGVVTARRMLGSQGERAGSKMTWANAAECLDTERDGEQRGEWSGPSQSVLSGSMNSRANPNSTATAATRRLLPARAKESFAGRRLTPEKKRRSVPKLRGCRLRRKPNEVIRRRNPKPRSSREFRQVVRLVNQARVETAFTFASAASPKVNSCATVGGGQHRLFVTIVRCRRAPAVAMAGATADRPAATTRSVAGRTS